jgi:hypothetical protein
MADVFTILPAAVEGQQAFIFDQLQNSTVGIRIPD